ncbi:kinase-like domain-containing protein [Sporodiniella umbellata]|nr:kinase-like domain-containing protein [Sporodiniella umbellata]
MEYCPGGGVIDLMNRRLQQRLTEPEILKIFSDVTEALAYMHYCNPPVLHRDLKVENILILNQDHYKLCDFGSAALSKGQYIPTQLKDVQRLEDDIQRHTTLQYRAPEMIDVYQKKPVNEKADIWAMGVLLYKLCYYTTPFEEEGQLAILNAKYTLPSSPTFSEGLCRLVMSMLQEDQSRRPTVYQVMASVCHLRGLECPIRDIYAESYMASPPSSATSFNESPSLFEKVPSPQQELPTITPMRRGRPTTKANEPYDPFDPTHVNKATPSVKSQESTQSTRNSFQNSFDSTPDEEETKVKMNRNVHSSIEARFAALKNSGKPKKPLPPPKPARFRSNPVPVEDFEHKFPSLEELDKHLPSVI